MLKIAVLVSGGGTNLQAILDACEDGIIKSGKVEAVVSSKEGAFALQRAKKHGIKSYVADRKSFESNDAFIDQLLCILNSIQPDLIVLAGFMCVLPERFVQQYPNKIINVHPSLIPSFCGDGYYGLRVHQAALDYGVKVSGATVHFVNEVTDGGAIIAQKAVNVKEDDTPEILQERIMEEAEWVILPQAIELFCSGQLQIENRKIRIKEQ